LAKLPQVALMLGCTIAVPVLERARRLIRGE
jgi:hypothetical protein